MNISDIKSLYQSLLMPFKHLIIPKDTHAPLKRERKNFPLFITIPPLNNLEKQVIENNKQINPLPKSR